MLDVEKWLTTDEEADRILDWWEAFDRIIPLANPWLQTALVCQEVSQLTTSYQASAGIKAEIKSVEDFMPPQWEPPERVSRAMSDDEQVAALSKIGK